MMIELHFLGTGSCYPSPKRGASCLAMRHEDGNVWLFDCGEGSQIQLQKSEIKPGRIDKIFITHLHGDHLFGLPGLLCTLGQNNLPESKLIDIYGPAGLGNYIRTSLNVSCSQLGYSYCVHEITNDTVTPYLENATEFHPNECQQENISINANGNWDVCTTDNFKISAYPLLHTIFCVGYLLMEAEIPGKLDSALLKAMGVPPGPLYGKIKRGQTIVLDNGREVKPNSVVGPSRKGRTFVVLGDTANSNSIIDNVDEVDFLVHEATVENEMQELAIERGHSTPGAALQILTIFVDELSSNCC
eukprot:Seg630.1 transcript_id=Seg630.1/GoldUCD/mRNA.D3Y31 product="Zinc phosphodiesterase ELAC protein 1" protein_id=Seg630.1/GoldUCD/D3Y31